MDGWMDKEFKNHNRRVCGETGILIVRENEEWHSHFGGQTVQQFLIKLNILVLYKPAFVFPGIQSKEFKAYVHKKQN